MKFKFIHKISVIPEKFLIFFNLLRGPDKTNSGAGSSPRVVHPCFIIICEFPGFDSALIISGLWKKCKEGAGS